MEDSIQGLKVLIRDAIRVERASDVVGSLLQESSSGGECIYACVVGEWQEACSTYR